MHEIYDIIEDLNRYHYDGWTLTVDQIAAKHKAHRSTVFRIRDQYNARPKGFFRRVELLALMNSSDTSYKQWAKFRKSSESKYYKYVKPTNLDPVWEHRANQLADKLKADYEEWLKGQ